MPLPLGGQVGLGPGDIVLDREPVPLPKKGAQQPSTFQSMSIVARQLYGSRCELVRRQALAQATLC